MPNKKRRFISQKFKKIIGFIKSNEVIKSTFLVLFVFSILSWLGLLKIGPVKIYEDKYITVIGNYVSTEPNQIASFTATITEINKDKNIVIESLAKKSTDLIDAVKVLGIDPMNIKTINNNLYQSDEPITSGNVKNTNIVEKKWRGSTSIEIKLDDISKIDQLNNVLYKFENTEIFGPNYSVNEKSVDEARLLFNALEDAKNKALFIAKNNNSHLGKIISIEEITQADITPYTNVLGMGGGDGSSPGSTRIVKTVKVKFELR